MSLLFSSLFFIASVACIFFGIYSLHIDRYKKINKIFFALCIALFIWSFAFSIAISAQNVGSALAWRRIAACGWGSFFCIFFHFSIVLTGKERVLKNRWILMLLYLPAAVIIFIFAVPNGILAAPFNMIHTFNGWINVASYNVWDWLFNVYYISYTIGSLFMVWRWIGRSPAIKDKSLMYAAVILFAVTLILGTLTDIFFNAFFLIMLPQIGPLIMIVPLTAFFLFIRHSGLLPAPLDDEELILGDEDRMGIYNLMSVACVAAGLLNYVAQYLVNNFRDLTSVILCSFFFIAVGGMIQIVHRSGASEVFKQNFNIATGALLIPIVTLRFPENAGVTVWATAFIMIIISMVFSKRDMLIAVAISSITTQVIVWRLSPNSLQVVGADNYIVRIGTLLVGIWIAYYINKAYVAKLAENQDQIRLRSLIADISTDFVSANQQNINRKIRLAMEKVGLYFNINRIHIFLIDQDENVLNCKYEWCGENIGGAIKKLQKIPAETLPWLMKNIRTERMIAIPNAENLPEEAVVERELLQMQNAQALLIFPIDGGGTILGFLAVQAIQRKSRWKEDHIDLFMIFANILADTLSRLEAEKAIQHMAFYDNLTKLPNRLLFNESVKQAIHLAKRTGTGFAIMFLDLDAFKDVNDTFGHDGGDELLVMSAERLSKLLRESDTISRFGGDEFLLLINELTEPEYMELVAEKIVAAFARPFLLKDREISITASIGIANYPMDGTDAETLIKNADIAMYNAKGKGKNRFALCTPQMKVEVGQRIEMTNALAHALEKDELLLYYQPQICLKTNRIIGLEALIRWQHPEMGMILPNSFIPLAENTGLINPIGEWVLRRACEQNKAWQDMGLLPVRMAVNISVCQLRNPGFVGLVERVLMQTGLAPEFLELEITESCAVNEPNYFLGLLNELKALGVSISIDDFGTEYSSLSRLKLLPIDRIKMDMQFVQGIDGTEKEQAITKVIINLARDLGLKVVAEGVETARQMTFLSRRMCDEVQGFYYFRPLPEEEVEKVLRLQDNDTVENK